MSGSRAASSDAIVVTGLGVVSAFGAGRETFWESLCSGTCGIRPLELFDTSSYRTQIGAAISEDDLGIDRGSFPRRSSRADRFGLLATDEAIADSGIDLTACAPGRVAVVLGAGVSGLFEAETWFRRVVTEQPTGRPSDLLHHFPDATTDAVKQRYGLAGTSSTVVTACSSSAVSIGLAADSLRAGLADVAITGGSDVLARLTYGGFNALKVVSPEPCRPFDAERNGMSIGEGAGILVLERQADAERRGAEIYCRFAGYGLTADAYHMTAPEPSGKAFARTMECALEQAGVDRGAVDYINAHGTATLHNDRAEAAAIHRVFGDRARSLPTSSIKSMIGHCLCSAGGLEAVSTVLTLRHNVLPPTLHYQTPDTACELDVVPNQARQQKVQVALSNSFAFGGNSASLVFAELG